MTVVMLASLQCLGRSLQYLQRPVIVNIARKKTFSPMNPGLILWEV